MSPLLKLLPLLIEILWEGFKYFWVYSRGKSQRDSEVIKESLEIKKRQDANNIRTVEEADSFWKQFNWKRFKK